MKTTYAVCTRCIVMYASFPIHSNFAAAATSSVSHIAYQESFLFYLFPFRCPHSTTCTFELRSENCGLMFPPHNTPSYAIRSQLCSRPLGHIARIGDLCSPYRGFGCERGHQSHLRVHRLTARISFPPTLCSKLRASPSCVPAVSSFQTSECLNHPVPPVRSRVIRNRWTQTPDRSCTPCELDRHGAIRPLRHTDIVQLWG